MSTPDEYYIIMPIGVFGEIKRMLKGKTGTDIPDDIREEIDKYLVDNGEWTDQNQLRKKDIPFTHWVTTDDMPHVIVEK